MLARSPAAHLIVCLLLWPAAALAGGPIGTFDVSHDTRPISGFPSTPDSPDSFDSHLRALIDAHTRRGVPASFRMGTGTYPSDITPAGTIVGSYVEPFGPNHAFVRARDGGVTTFDAPGAGPQIGQGTNAVGVDPAGDLLGYYIDSNSVGHGFLLRPGGALTTFDALGASNEVGGGTYASRINASGTIIGFLVSPMVDCGPPGSGTRCGYSHAFMRNPDGTIVGIEPPGSVSSLASAINPAGVITGVFGTATESHAFVRSPEGLVTAFDVPGFGVTTQPTAINPAGTIAGNYFPPAVNTAVNHGFVRSASGAIETFDPPGSQTTFVTGIDPAGTVIGFYLAGDGGGVRGFVRNKNGGIDSFTGNDEPRAFTIPTAIDEAGTITGWYLDTQGIHGFVTRR